MTGDGFREAYATAADGLRLYYREYGQAQAAHAPVLCLPGLTRNSKDFHDLALRLSAQRRVIAVDLRGRGRSERDPRGAAGYSPLVELDDVLRLIAQASLGPSVVIGTSRGGILAMLMASVRPDLLRGIVLNDIGPELDPAGIARIRGYVGVGEAPESWEAAASALEALHGAHFPGLSAQDWLAYARRSFTEREGRPAFDYDPAIGESLRGAPAGDLWPQFAALAAIPTLVLRGAHSDLLSAETVARMREQKPDLLAVTVPDRGHVPFLDEPEVTAALDAFLARIDGGQNDSQSDSQNR